MSLVECSGCEMNPSYEWAAAGAQTSRDTSVKRTGAASVKSALTVSLATAQFNGWGGTDRYSAALLHWVLLAFRFDAVPPTNYDAWGPILATYTGTATPKCLTIHTVGASAYLAIYDGTLNLLATSATAIVKNTWYALKTEWDFTNKRFRAWIWNAGTSAWDLHLDYTSANAWSGSFRPTYGFFSLKTSSLSVNAWTDDILWLDNLGGDNDLSPASPAECYALYPVTGAPTYTAWTNDWDEVDDLVSGGAVDSDTTRVISTGNGTKESFLLTDSACPGTRPVLGVGLMAYTRTAVDNDTALDLLMLDSAAEVDLGALITRDTYFGYSYFRDRTPAGNIWTPAAVDAIELGLHRVSGADVAYCTAVAGVAVECTLPNRDAYGQPQVI